MKKEKKIMTEALARSKDSILLGRRKKDGFGQGKWLGLGGKVEVGETIEQAMKIAATADVADIPAAAPLPTASEQG